MPCCPHSARVARPETQEASMSKVEKSIEVNVPLSTAYNQWTQFEEFPRLYSRSRNRYWMCSPRLKTSGR